MKIEVQQRSKGDKALIWYSAVAKPSVSHVRRLLQALFSRSRIYGAARLIVARLGPRAIFSRAKATLLMYGREPFPRYPPRPPFV